DGLRTTQIAFEPAPRRLTAAQAEFELTLPPHGETTIQMTVSCAADGRSAAANYDRACAAAGERLRIDPADCTVETSHEGFNVWLRRSRCDLRMMVSTTPQGPYPYAGVPWFSTPFGRDGVLTALECLWFDPGLARGV